MTEPRLVLLPAVLLLLAAAPLARFAAPLQPWRSPDGHVALLRPAIAPPDTSDAPPGAPPAIPGRIILRLSLPTAPAGPAGEGPGTERLRLGATDDPATVRACLAGATSWREINGVRYAMRGIRDTGTDLRAVVGGRCYAIARVHDDTAPGIRGPVPNAMPRARAAALLDAALASLRISAGTVAMPAAPRVRMPPGTVAR